MRYSFYLTIDVSQCINQNSVQRLANNEEKEATIKDWLNKFQLSPKCVIKLWHHEEAQDIRELRSAIIDKLGSINQTSSYYGLNILRNTESQKEIKDTSRKLKKDWNENKIQNTVATVAWQALMQASIQSVKERQTLTMIFSTRFVWFVKLKCRKNNKETPCTICVSNGYQIGKPGFNKSFLLFLNEARKSASEEKVIKSFVNDALIVGVETKEDSKKVSTGKISTPDKGISSATEEDVLFHPKTVSPDTASKVDDETIPEESYMMTVEDQMEWERALTPKHLQMLSTGEHLAEDQHGVIPYLHQIETDSKTKVLGNGRNGVVHEIGFKTKNKTMKVAKKVYRVVDDDNYEIPSSHERYEHELKVLYECKELQGKYIPKLIFHNPWPSCPSVGLQLGEPVMEDVYEWDHFDEWKSEDIQKKDETINELKKLGWEQKDMRGWNFVRLKGDDEKEYIAMIDFESMSRIEN